MEKMVTLFRYHSKRWALLLVVFTMVICRGQITSVQAEPTDNAALQYYQAILLVKELTKEETKLLGKVHSSGYEDDKAIKDLGYKARWPLEYALKAYLHLQNA